MKIRRFSNVISLNLEPDYSLKSLCHQKENQNSEEPHSRKTASGTLLYASQIEVYSKHCHKLS